MIFGIEDILINNIAWLLRKFPIFAIPGTGDYQIQPVPELAFFLSYLIGYMIRDMILTKDEIKGLMSNLLVSKNPPTGKTHLEEWLEQNANRIGIKYASELGRNYR